MNPFTLNAVKAGITRLRTKGGASAESLWDLINAYVTASRTVVPKPGSRTVHNLPAGTIGLCYFRGKRYVFSHTVVVMTDPKYVCMVLRHPDDTDESIALREIHFAEPLLGYLFVVAEFINGDIFYYWMQDGTAWQANTIYLIGQVVVPTSQNGYGYRASRIGEPNPTWKPNTPYVVGNKIEPTAANGYYYEVIDTIGANPTSGANEPSWPAVEGAQVIEEVDGSTTNTGDTDGNGTPQVPPDVDDRYNQRYGGGQ